ncbi:hypothetical protein C8J57DRAFT_1222603 [Mycena rebaudengoi]|nr:hypothetical protein C8J57DRAFT_1222603 [Mycena rebaudengoi]
MYLLYSIQQPIPSIIFAPLPPRATGTRRSYVPDADAKSPNSLQSYGRRNGVNASRRIDAEGAPDRRRGVVSPTGGTTRRMCGHAADNGYCVGCQGRRIYHEIASRGHGQSEGDPASCESVYSVLALVCEGMRRHGLLTATPRRARVEARAGSALASGGDTSMHSPSAVAQLAQNLVQHAKGMKMNLQAQLFITKDSDGINEARRYQRSPARMLFHQVLRKIVLPMGFSAIQWALDWDCSLAASLTQLRDESRERARERRAAHSGGGQSVAIDGDRGGSSRVVDGNGVSQNDAAVTLRRHYSHLIDSGLAFFRAFLVSD